MTGLEVTLIIIGIACICISFFVSKKSGDEEPNQQGTQSSAIWTEKEEKKIKERVDDILTERQNDLVDSTEDQMNRLCNEKIMAVDEFSRQVLEKIENNHQEVVFMYNMLNEKQKEIKDMVTEPVRKEKKTSEKLQIQTQAQTAIEKIAHKETKEKTVPISGKKKQAEVKNKKTENKSTVPGNVNLQIQKMYKEGKSILDISRELNIGQGEVKLVIALYGGRKG